MFDSLVAAEYFGAASICQLAALFYCDADEVICRLAQSGIDQPRLSLAGKF